MKGKKRITAILLTFAMIISVFGASGLAFAYEVIDPATGDVITDVNIEDDIAIDDEIDFDVLLAQLLEGVTVVLDGEPIFFDVAPQIIPETGRVIVPLRAVFEAMGAEVDWDDETKTATATKEDTVVVLTIGSEVATINGEEQKLDQPAVIVEERTLAPLRFVAEAFGGTIEWEGEYQIAWITLYTDVEAVEEEEVEEDAVEEDAADDNE